MAGMCCLLAAITSSCAKDDWNVSDSNKLKATNITISIAGVNDKVISRADATSARTDRSRIERLDIVLANRGEITKYINFDETTVPTIENDNFDDTGLVVGSSGLPVIAPREGIYTDIKFRIGLADMKGVTDIYLVANYIGRNGTLTAINQNNAPTVAALNALQQGMPTTMETSILCTMFGHINMMADRPDASDDQNRDYTVLLERTLAMITLAIDGTELADGVKVTPISAKLINVPQYCTINGNYPNRAHYSATETETKNWMKEGSFVHNLNNSWGPICNVATAERLNEGKQVVPYAWPEGFSWADFESGDITKYIDASGPHGTQEAVYPLFMFENEQGVNSAVTDEVNKKPDIADGNDAANNYSYIEVLAAYQHSTQAGGNPQVGDRFGNITYRFYLGGNVTTDFNVERNKHYMLTLKLGGLGGLKEDGYINPDGSWNADGGDVSWRVDAGFTNSGIVDETALEVPANGSRVDFDLVGYPPLNEFPNGNSVHFEFTNGSNNIIWLYSFKENAWIQNPGNNDLRDYLYSNSDGTYTIRIYVKPLGTTEFNGIYNGTIEGAGSAGQAPLNTLEKWEKYGYRELAFGIKGFKGSQAHLNRPIAENPIKVRQWLPMPVMESGTNPYNQTLFFSRFDIYHGKMLPWCHNSMHNMNLLPPEVDANTELVTTGLNITDNGTAQGYDRTNGFHKTVAFFRTNINKGMEGQISFNDALPQTMMAYSFYAAANAETATDGGMFVQRPQDANTLSHYGLPSVEEWEKIEKYGRFDSRYPITAGMEYWSSTVDDRNGTRSMVYMMGTGKEGAAPATRDREHLGRLVYRKNIQATR